VGTGGEILNLRVVQLSGLGSASNSKYRTHLDHLERNIVELAVQNITM